jgi:hypothetical protein
MHHQVDRGQQSGGGFGITFPLTPSAVSSSVLDNVKSVSVSISGGKKVRLAGGRCIFDVPGVEISNWQEFNIPDREYDTRTTVTGTWNNTRLGDSAPTGTTAVGGIGMQVGDVHAHTDIPSGILPGHEGRTTDWHKRNKAELEAKASSKPLDKEEQKKLQESKDYLKAAAEKRKAELMAKRKARTLTPEEAEELQPILDREAAERHARQQAQVDAIKAEEQALHDRIHAEAREKEKADRRRQQKLETKQKKGGLTQSERAELEDLLDREAAKRTAQPAVASSKPPVAAKFTLPEVVNTDNLTAEDREKIQQMADRSGGCQEVKKDQITQAEKMLAYLKSRLPADKADQAFKELAEKGIFNRALLASAGSVAGLGASLVVTVETLSGIALAPEIAMVALIVGGVYITYEVVQVHMI